MSSDFFFGVFCFLVARWLVLLYNQVAFQRLTPRPTPHQPRASLLVPARNEEANLRRTLPGLLRQGALEVLVLDDLSEDGTADLVRAAAERYPTLRLLAGAPLPVGWRGKNWAAWQLAQAAKGEVLVFTDADVFWEEGALGALLDALERADLVSALPKQEAGPEGPVVSFVMNGLFSFLPRPALEALGIANGQVLAVCREAYIALGGHEAVRGEVLEDVALARRARRVRLYRGERLFRVRMYPSYPEALRGFAKNFLAIHLEQPIVLFGSAFYHVALYTLPWLFGRWDLGFLGVLERLLVQRALGGPLWPALFTPLAPVLLAPVYVMAVLPGRRWKGRPV